MEGADEGGVFGVGAGCLGEEWVVTRDDEAEDEERDDVEERHAPEDLLGGLGEGLARVVGLGCSESNELGSGEGEGGSDEDGAEALEAVLEGLLRGMPVLHANVSSVLHVSSGSGNRAGWWVLWGGKGVPGVSGNTTTVDDDAGEDEADDSNDLDRAEDELDFTVATDTKDVDEDNDDEEDGDPHAVADARIIVCIVSCPEADGDAGGDQFEGEDDKPRHGVVPAHGETP